MMLLPIPLWLIGWAIIAIAMAVLEGLPAGTHMPDTALTIFVCGGMLRPLVGWSARRSARRANED